MNAQPARDQVDGILLLLALGFLIALFFTPFGVASADGGRIEYGLTGAEYQGLGRQHQASYGDVEDGDSEALGRLQAGSIMVMGSALLVLILALVAFLSPTPLGTAERIVCVLNALVLAGGCALMISGFFAHYADADISVRLHAGTFWMVGAFVVLMGISMRTTPSLDHRPPVEEPPAPVDAPTPPPTQPEPSPGLRPVFTAPVVSALNLALAGTATLCVASFIAVLYVPHPFFIVAIVSAIAAGFLLLARLSAPFLYTRTRA